MKTAIIIFPGSNCDIEMERLWEKLYEEHLEEVSKRIKDIGKAEQEARVLKDEQVENMQ